MPEMCPFPAREILVGRRGDAAPVDAAARDGWGLDAARTPGLNVSLLTLPPATAQAEARERVVRRVHVPNLGTAG
jgi:hypothetical protein